MRDVRIFDSLKEIQSDSESSCGRTSTTERGSVRDSVTYDELIRGTQTDLMSERESRTLYVLRTRYKDRMRSYLKKLLVDRYLARWKKWTNKIRNKRQDDLRQEELDMYSLNRFLIDSREADENIVWIGHSGEKQSFLFAHFPPPGKYLAPDTWYWKQLQKVASMLLLTGEGLYTLPERRGGVILYEIPFSQISAMDYSNGLTTDGRWAVETKVIWKRNFPSAKAMCDFIKGKVMPPAIVVLAGVVAATISLGRASHPLLMTCFEYPADPIELPWSIGFLVDSSSEDENPDSLEVSSHSYTHRYPHKYLKMCVQVASASSGLPPSPEPLPLPPRSYTNDCIAESPTHCFPSHSLECQPIRTNMLVTYFNDSAAARLPQALWSVLQKKENSRELKLIESGMPSWAMFLPQRRIYYRTWIRIVVQTIAIIWPIVTLIAALIDLYRSFEAIRSIAHVVSNFFNYLGQGFWYCVACFREALWSMSRPVLEGILDTLGDWWSVVVLEIWGYLKGTADFIINIVYLVVECITAFPVFSYVFCFLSCKFYWRKKKKKKITKHTGH